MNKAAYAGLVLFATAIMGVAFPIGKMGLAYATPFLLMGIRFVAAGGLLAVIMARRPLPRGKMWLQAAVIGLFQSAGVMGCAYYSMRWITSGESSIITCTNPLMVIIMGTIFTGAVYKLRQWIGVVVGIVGVAFAFGFHLGFEPGTWIALGGALSFAIATMLVKQWGPAFDMTVLAAYQMLFGGLALLLLSAIAEHPHFAASGASVGILLVLIILCSLVQFPLWFYLLGRGDPAKTSAFLFLVPVFGVLSSWLLLGEKVQWYVGAGGALISVGIYLVNRGSKASAANATASLTAGAAQAN